jgi:hypothetical protein
MKETIPMGHWTIHIEGHGIHDNGRPDDADARLRDFTDQLAADGHEVHSASITVGSTRELLNRDDTTPLRQGETTYRPRQ